MLPHEAEVTAEIAAKYRVQLDAMAGLHNAVVAMITAGSWTIGKRGQVGSQYESRPRSARPARSSGGSGCQLVLVASREAAFDKGGVFAYLSPLGHRWVCSNVRPRRDRGRGPAQLPAG